MQTTIFFKSEKHRARFLAGIQQLGKVYDGLVDPEYGAVIYLLAGSGDTWEKAQDYISPHSLGLDRMLEEVHLSGGHAILVQLAGNLFNGNLDINPVEFMRLDEPNFQLALGALLMRRRNWPLESFRK